MKNKGLILGTAIGIGIGTATGIGIGTGIGIIALGIMGVDFNCPITFWISTGMAVGGGISLVNYVIKSIIRQATIKKSGIS